LTELEIPEQAPKQMIKHDLTKLKVAPPGKPGKVSDYHSRYPFVEEPPAADPEA